MKIVVAPDSFKGSVAATEVASMIKRTLKKVNPSWQIMNIPMADGGEGTVDAILQAKQGKLIPCHVTGPNGEKVEAFYGMFEQTAVIEVAAVVGFHLLVENERNPMQMTTFGVGELILHALDHSVRQFIIGLGGTVTNDGGIGMMQALGASVLDKDGKQVSYGGTGLAQVDKLSLETVDERLDTCQFTIATDVMNPLIGSEGATYVYGKQKGASDSDLHRLEKGMKHYASIILRHTGKDVSDVKGAGAAGGLGAAFVTLFNTPLQSGFDVIANITGLTSHIKDATFVITGEGKLDKQSAYGKVPYKISTLAKKHGTKVIIIAGTVAEDIHVAMGGADYIFSLTNKLIPRQYAMHHAQKIIPLLTEQIAEKIMNEAKK